MAVIKWGTEQVVSTTAISGQFDPVTVALSDGGYVAIWDDSRYTGIDADLDVIRAQRYDAGGNPVGSDFVVSTTNAGQQRNPSATLLSDGKFVVVWEDASGSPGDTSGTAIRGRIFGSDGTPSGTDFVVNTTTSGDQKEPSVAALAAGGFVVTWTDGSETGGDTSGTQIRAQVFNSTGGAVGTEFRVNSTTDNDQFRPIVTGLSDGSFAVAWIDDSLPEGEGNVGWDLREQRFAANGTALGAEHLINETIGFNEGLPAIAALEGGGFVVAWSYLRGTPGGLLDLTTSAYFQLFDSNGAQIGANTEVWKWPGVGGDPTPMVNQYSPAVVGLKDGGFLVSWDDPYGSTRDVWAVEFSEQGQRLTSTPLAINTTTEEAQVDSHLSILSDGRVVAVFENDGRISAQLLDPRDGTVDGTANSETLYGNDAYGDMISGLAGNDTLYGLAGNDVLIGGEGIDSMFGGSGNDSYYIDNANDTLSDPSGVDTVGSTVSWTLGAGIENLTLMGIGAASGAGNSGANIIRGNDAANILSGLSGNDSLHGGGGRDILRGGAGRDVMSGGADRDVFDFNLRTETGITSATRDIIMDFRHLVDDIDLKSIDASTLLAGNNSFVWRETAAFTSSQSGEVRYVKVNNTGTANDYTVIFGDTDSDTASEFQIKLMGLVTLSSADFVL